MALYGKNPKDALEIKEFTDFVYETRGINLNAYRQSFLWRRLRLRLSVTGSKDCSQYIRYIKDNPKEFDLLLDSISINTSEFFRDPAVFNRLKTDVLEKLIKEKEATGNKTLRIWSAGCSKGQEAYSLAILIKEVLRDRTDFTVRLWAADIDNDALEKARQAQYELNELKGVNKEIVEKYFISVYNGCYKLTDEIRKMVKFERLNITSDAGPKCLDLILCRYLMIYLNKPQQAELFGKFNQLLKRSGYLVLGLVENIWDTDLFAPVYLRQKIYQKQGG